MPQFQVGTPVLEVDVSGTTATLTWTLEGRQPNEFVVLRNSAVIAVISRTRETRSYTDSGLVPGTVYTYQVRAVKGGFSEDSNLVQVTVPPVLVPVTAPVLTATSGAGQVSLSWTAVANADSYSWQRATGAGAFGASTNTTSLTATDGTVVNGTLYRFRVRGTANAGADTGPWSNIVSVTPTTGVPVAPTLTGEAGDSLNTLAWDDPADAATYRLRRQVGTNPMDIFNMDATDYIDSTAVNDTTYQYTVRGITTGGDLGAVSNPVDLTPVADAPAEVPAIVGYAAVAGVTGGTGGTTYNVSTFAALRTALERSGPRIINITGSGVLNGNGANFEVTHGNVTVDGTNWTGSMKDYSIIWRCSNIILRELAWRPGEGATAALSTDRRAVTFNPSTTSGPISRILLDHCSFAWGPDVVASFLNATSDVTAQFCMFGPGLYQSNLHPEGTAYGPNITDTAGGSGVTARITYYRCLMPMNKQRSLRAFATIGWDAVNCVVYDWGRQSGHGNPRGANLVGNMFKKGPETLNNRGWFSELGGANDQTWNLNSVYFPTDATQWNRNIGFNANGTPLDLDNTFAIGVRRSTPYDGGAGAANHGAIAVVTPDATLLETVTNAAGRTHQDAIDIAVKAHVIAGTSDGYYNGAGFVAPHPSW